MFALKRIFHIKHTNDQSANQGMVVSERIVPVTRHQFSLLADMHLCLCKLYVVFLMERKINTLIARCYEITSALTR